MATGLRRRVDMLDGGTSRVWLIFDDAGTEGAIEKYCRENGGTLDEYDFVLIGPADLGMTERDWELKYCQSGGM